MSTKTIFVKNLVFVAVSEFGKPLVAADSFDNLNLILDEYYGIDRQNPESSIDPYAKCLGFSPYDTKYPDEYEGFFTYEFRANPGGSDIVLEKEKIDVYVIEYETTKESTTNFKDY